MKCSLLFILVSVLLSSNITFSQGNIILYNTSHPFEKTYKFPRSDGAKDFYIRHQATFPANMFGKMLRLQNEQIIENNHNDFLTNGSGFLLCFGFYYTTYYFYVNDFRKSAQDSNVILKALNYYEDCEPGISIHLSFNNGLNSQMDLWTFGDNPVCEIDPNNDNYQYYYAGFWDNNIYKSTNRGLNWFTSGNVIYPNNIIRVKPGNSDIIFAGGNELYRSTNGGINFHSLNLNQLNITSIEFHPGGKIFLTSDGTNAGIFLSTDNGSNWQNVLSIKTSCIETDPDNKSRIYSGTEHGIYLSLDEGITWGLYNNDFNPNRNIIGLMKNPGTLDTLYAVNSNNIYKIYESIIVEINEISGSIPEDYILYQNYPNPFNPSTVISYSLKENSFVTLKVFDITGREISVLVNEKQNAGKYDVHFSTQSNKNKYDIPSGVYFYQLTANDFIETKRMILLK